MKPYTLKIKEKGKRISIGVVKVTVNHYTTIDNPATAVQLEFGVLRANPGNMAYDSCRLRLIEFKEWMERQE